jgi:hypothetical protein
MDPSRNPGGGELVYGVGQLNPRIWDSDRMGRISVKFAHFVRAREKYNPAKKLRPSLNF